MILWFCLYLWGCVFDFVSILFIVTPQRPQNPMLNSGAINITSLLKKQMGKSDRFDWVSVIYVYISLSTFYIDFASIYVFSFVFN